MSKVVLQNLRKRFTDPVTGEAFEALKGIDLSIEGGQCFSLLGPSGCGKSTLLRILSGLEHPDSGQVLIDGKDVTRLPPEKRPTAMVFQNYALFPHLTVEGNVSFGLKLRGKSRSEIAKKVEDVLALVQLEGLNRRKMRELSGGQQQRVALARVLAIEPEILLMDEPLSNLDASLRRSTRSTIRRIQQQLGLTLVYVTHDQEEALLISDRIAVMSQGEILQEGSPEALYEHPTSAEVAAFLGQRNMIAGWVGSVGAEGVTVRLEATEGAPAVTIPGVGEACGDLKAGDAVWFAAKPTDLALADAGAEGWPGEVLLSSFAGGGYEVEVSPEGQSESVRLFQPLDGKLRSHGDRVVIVASGGLVFGRGRRSIGSSSR